MLDVLCSDIIMSIYEKINLIDVLNLSQTNRYTYIVFNDMKDNNWIKIAKNEYADFYWLFLDNIKYNKIKKPIRYELYDLYNFKSKYEKLDRIDTLLLFYIFKLIKL